MDNLKKWIGEHIHKMDIDEPESMAWDHIKHGLLKPEENDALKNYLANNSSELEIEKPDADSWEKISSAIITRKRAPLQRIKKSLVYLSAACIISIMCLGVVKFMGNILVKESNKVAGNTGLKNSTPPASNPPDTTNTAYINADPIATKPSYNRQPEQKVKQNKTTVAFSSPVKKQKKAALPPEVLQMQNDYNQLISGQIAYTKSLAVYGEDADYFNRFMNDFKLLDQQEKELRKSIVQYGLQDNSIDNLATIYQQKLTVLKKLQNEIAKTTTRNKNITDTVPVYIKL